MSRLVEISNLKDFDDYRQLCPFCSSPLKCMWHNSIIRGTPQNYSPITARETDDHYILTYDGTSSFATLVSSYISRILIHRVTNDITYELQDNVVFPAEHIGSALNTNKVTIHKRCDCSYDYHLISGVIDLSSIHNGSCSPEVFSESFCVDQQETTTFTKITMMYRFNKTKISCFDLSPATNFACTYERDIPLLNLPWDDIDAVLKKIRVLLTFS